MVKCVSCTLHFWPAWRLRSGIYVLSLRRADAAFWQRWGKRTGSEVTLSINGSPMETYADGGTHPAMWTHLERLVERVPP